MHLSQSMHSGSAFDYYESIQFSLEHNNVHGHLATIRLLLNLHMHNWLPYDYYPRIELVFL